MQAGPLDLTIGAWLGLLAVLYLRRALGSHERAPFVDVLFALALAMAVAAAFASGPFDRAARLWIDRTGLPSVLRDADDRIAAVEDLPERVWDAVRGPFAALLEDEDEELPEQLPEEGVPGPAPPDALPDAPAEPSGGPLEETVVPAVAAVLEVWMRVAAFGSAHGAMAFAWLLRPTRGVRRRLFELEARVARLERPKGPPGDDDGDATMSDA